MKITKKAFLLLLFSMMFSMPAAHAMEDLRTCYFGLGVGFHDSFSLRAGFFREHLGFEVYAKSDFSRLTKKVEELDGKKHRFSVMGGITYQPWYFIFLTAHVGYGSAGIYQVDATQTQFGAIELKKGLEVGACVSICFGDGLMLFGGCSLIPERTNVMPFSEFTVGVGFAF